MGLSGAEEEYPGNQLTLNLHQQVHARRSARAGGLGLPSTKVRRMSASISSRVGALREILKDLTATEFPESGIVV